MPSVIEARTAQDLEPGPQVEALLFDWDGTLFDNYHFNYLAMAAGLREWGVEIGEEWFVRNAGYSARRMVALAAQERGVDVDPLEVLAARDRLSVDLVHEVRPVTPVLDLLGRYAGRLGLAVVTGSERSNIDSTLGAFGLREAFDVIVTRDQVTRGKPDPECFLVAAAQLGVEPARALVYEDSDQGVVAALAAGMDVVDVRSLVRP
ncbi:MAG: HAD-IA family hydrolase [Salana multivorans]|uniref:HAD family hydrolase n=1 Tax=Salana multivorans TaxID=120377 RepID=UPI000969A3DC|nr:HAD-IA family hydrolase [Salana multivorans]MBN8881161.1 HAD-IA family hydrolase [Salana multivorans]OJX97800.1 MAG: hypothetical protein BGO96_12780 [Micrococcales bacterium 73-15]